MEPVVALARESGVEVTGSMATALGCPFEGKVPFERVLYVAEAYRAMGVSHISVADTVGVADPRLVYETMSGLKESLPDIALGSAPAQHARDGAGQRARRRCTRASPEFDSSVGGLGGCPFAPGATGNISTEDLVHMLDLMGVRTGVDLDCGARRRPGREGGRRPPARERRRARGQVGATCTRRRRRRLCRGDGARAEAETIM